MKARATCFMILFVAVLGWTAELSAQTLYLNNSSQSNAQYVIVGSSGSGEGVLKPDFITVEMWAKTSAWNQKGAGSYVSLISNTSSSGYDIYMNGTDVFFETWIPGYNYIFPQYAVSNLVNDQWHHFAGTWDGTQGKLFIDGVLVNSTTPLGSSYAIQYVSSTETILGCEAETNGGTEGGHYFDGYIKDLRVWNYARSETEIRNAMYMQLSGSESGLIGYFKLDETSGTAAANSVSGGETGTLVNNPTWVAATAPMSALQTGYTTAPQALWGATGTSDSRSSTGMVMAVGSALADGNNAVFGNNNTNGTSKSDLPGGVAVRSARIWYVDKAGTVSPNITIDLVEATGNSVTPGTAGDYRLLYRSGTSGDFSELETGDVLNGNLVTFNSVGLTSGYFAVGGTSSEVLPVELTSFTAAANAAGVTLEWKTACETANAGFEIEKQAQTSAGAGIWTKIGFVEGHGTTQAPHVYTFVDAAAAGSVSYRLKQMDRTGTFAYSDVVTVAAAEGALLNAHPNPFNPTTTIAYSVRESGRVRLAVYDLLGRCVAVLIDQQQEARTYSVVWDASAMASGTYIVRLETMPMSTPGTPRVAVMKAVIMK